ncbi:NADP-dependent methylenetetrahydromethanopterin/methylenetetrahydrofolate dehydrogenase [Lignipirellula cremea]|nr:NADP-dependent methylenetetrahydromethanopterin/methylenetetrahydrofolate dehydrogenase [Lignipirellula cremea]
MTKPKILIQFDSDRQASVFDAVTAIDAGVDQILQYAGVEPAQIRDLVPGAIFTRGPKDLHNTALFIGGSDVRAGESVLTQATSCFVGPMRVSVMLDANGCNTTAAAAVLSAARHVDLAQADALVLAATGPVGQRAARMLASEGASVRIASRSLDRAKAVCQAISDQHPEAKVSPYQTLSPQELSQAIEGAQVIISAGALGVELLTEENWQSSFSLRVIIDLNAMPPLGVAGLDMQDSGVERHGAIAYGAIGVGGLKMKIHKAAIRQLFQANDQVLDAEEILQLGRTLIG